MLKKLLFISISLLFIEISYSQNIRVMTYNIKYDATWDTVNNWNTRKDAMVKQLNYYNPSIIGTQEGLHHQLGFLKDNLKNFDYVGFARTDGKTKGEYSAIFYNTSMYDIEKTETFWLSTTPEKFSVGWDASMERICTYAILKHKRSSKKLMVFNAHFDHIGKVARAESAKLIHKKIEEVNADLNIPVVLMGDFNLTPDSDPIKYLNMHYEDGKVLSKKPFYGPEGTYNGFKNFEVNNRIDFIFSKGFEVKSYIHIDDRMQNNKHISDHLPVLSILKF